VAHREEILQQSWDTFRRIRPDARLGFYTGQQREPDADVLFASIQTLGRAAHLERFPRDAFDYIVVDEFHHAAAPTGRRLIDHFRPRLGQSIFRHGHLRSTARKPCHRASSSTPARPPDLCRTWNDSRIVTR
jgi:hypothetical protein